jgi:hypothetical protein
MAAFDGISLAILRRISDTRIDEVSHDETSIP